jgi:hypothetical protein
VVRPLVAECLRRFVDGNLMIEENGKYLSLAVLVDQNYDAGPVADQRMRQQSSSRSASEPELSLA